MVERPELSSPITEFCSAWPCATGADPNERDEFSLNVKLTEKLVGKAVSEGHHEKHEIKGHIG